MVCARSFLFETARAYNESMRGHTTLAPRGWMGMYRSANGRGVVGGRNAASAALYASTGFKGIEALEIEDTLVWRSSYAMSQLPAG